jgi:gamma-glutamyltranspeptidase
MSRDSVTGRCSAVDRHRFSTDHHPESFRQAPPKLESLNAVVELGEDVLSDLRARGHKVKVVKSPISHPVVIRVDRETGRFEAAGDPRAKRHAAAY